MGIVGANRLEATFKKFGTFRMAINAAASLSSRELFSVGDRSWTAVLNLVIVLSQLPPAYKWRSRQVQARCSGAPPAWPLLKYWVYR